MANGLVRTLHCAFIGEFDQQTNQRKHLRSETAARLSLLTRYILRCWLSCSINSLSMYTIVDFFCWRVYNSY